MRSKTLRRQAGFTLTEVLIAIMIITVVVGLIYTIYQRRVRPSVEASNLMTTFISVVQSLEEARSANNNAYPARDSAVSIDGDEVLLTYIGQNSNDVVGWLYQCPTSVGSLSTMTIQIPIQGLRDETVNRVIQRISSMPGWSATSDGNFIQAEHPGVACR